jgi:hypothetical protein
MTNQEKFWAVMQSAQSQRFAWGSFDCVTHAMRCVIAMTGDESIEGRVREVFGDWSDARAAARAHGGDLVGCISKILGEPVAWTRLTLGDVALVKDDEGRDVVAIHDGVHLLVPVAVGLKPIPPDRAMCGWRLKH